MTMQKVSLSRDDVEGGRDLVRIDDCLDAVIKGMEE